MLISTIYSYPWFSVYFSSNSQSRCLHAKAGVFSWCSCLCRFMFIPGLGDLFCTHFITIIGMCFFGLSFPSGVFYWFWRFSLIRLLILIVIVIKIINSSLFYCKIPRPSYADFEWQLDPFSLFIRLSILLYRWLLCYLCTLRTLP